MFDIAGISSIWHDPFPTLAETPMAKGKFFDNLNAEQKITFEQKPITVMVLENTVIDEVRDMFLRLQNGTPLNAQQKRDAMGTSIGREAKVLSTLPFFKKSVYFDNHDAAHHLVVSQMLNLELKEKIVSCTSQQLDKLYENYKKTNFDSTVVSKSKKVIELLGKIFPDNNPHLNQNYTLSLYWLLSRILLNYNILSSDGSSRNLMEKKFHFTAPLDCHIQFPTVKEDPCSIAFEASKPSGSRL